MTVIVGVDSSEASKAALWLAAQEARWRQASLVAVSAYELPLSPVGGFPGAAMHTQGEEQATAEAELDALTQKVIEAGLAPARRDREVYARVFQHPFRIVAFDDGRLDREQRRIETDRLFEITHMQVNMQPAHWNSPC